MKHAYWGAITAASMAVLHLLAAGFVHRFYDVRIAAHVEHACAQGIQQLTALTYSAFATHAALACGLVVSGLLTLTYSRKAGHPHWRPNAVSDGSEIAPTTTACAVDSFRNEEGKGVTCSSPDAARAHPAFVLQRVKERRDSRICALVSVCTGCFCLFVVLFLTTLTFAEHMIHSSYSPADLIELEYERWRARFYLDSSLLSVYIILCAGATLYYMRREQRAIRVLDS